MTGGNWKSPRGEDAYSSVVGTESLRLAFFIAELNHLQIIATDVGKAYLHGYTKEKVYIIAGPEFGEMKGHHLIILKSLYRLKTSGVQWHETLSATLRQHKFLPSKADPDIWMREIL